MPDPSLFRLRVWFKKRGRCAMLAHLEVARTVEREVRRAQLPFAVSNGFSPHMRVSLGSALPVGVGGEHECFDVFLTRYVAPDKACATLSAASSPDLAVTSCEYVGAREPSASDAYPVSVYDVELARQLTVPLNVPEHVDVVRKKRTRRLAVDEFLLEPPKASDDGTEVFFTTQAKDTGATMRPDVFAKAVLRGQWDDLDRACEEQGEVLGLGAMSSAVVSITRVEQRRM